MSSPQPLSRATAPVNEHRCSYSEVAKTPPQAHFQSPSLSVISPGKVLEAIAGSGGIKDSIHSPIPKQATLLDAGFTSSTSNKDVSSGTKVTNSTHT